MDSKRKQAKTSQIKSFGAAFRGIFVLLRNERNFRFHLFAAVIVLLCCYFFNVEKSEWLVVLLLIGLVFCMEALNTAIEYICDLVSPEYHPMVKNIKDISAAGVLLAAIIAAIAGCVIFIPYIMAMIHVGF
ncbi:MAG: diacylglycerol kinase family protein [Candidatus Azobacteroides sp.]|nr:diacylglycerol kinase family protein [Candidatus Azobacteroides sp.]